MVTEIALVFVEVLKTKSLWFWLKNTLQNYDVCLFVLYNSHCYQLKG